MNKTDLSYTTRTSTSMKMPAGKDSAEHSRGSLEDYYRRSGIHAIYQLAGAEDGGITWARTHAFDTTPLYPGDTDLVLHSYSVDSITDRINEVRATASPSDQQRLDDLTTQLHHPVSDADYPTPKKIAELAGDDHQLGEQVMRGSSWWAMKIL